MERMKNKRVHSLQSVLRLHFSSQAIYRRLVAFSVKQLQRRKLRTYWVTCEIEIESRETKTNR